MNRIVIGVVGAAVVAAAGVSGFWFWNKTEAENQIEMSLVALQRAGVETRHEGLEIEGFPLSYTGKLKNFTARIPAQGVSFAFPEFRAGMSAASVGTVDFNFPAEFFVTLIDQSGAETGQVFVQSENLAANVRPTDQGAYDLGVLADMLRVSRGSSGPASTDFVAFTTFDASGELTADAAAKNIVVDFGANAETVEASFLAAAAPASEPSPVKIAASKASLAADGDLLAQKGKLSVERLAVDATPNGGFQLSDFTLDLNSTAADGFDPSSLFEAGKDAAAEPEDVLALLLRIAAESVVQGGAIETTMSVGDAAGSMLIPTEDGFATTKVISRGLTYRTGLAPERIGGSIVAESFRLEVEDAAGIYYDLTNATVALTLDAADKFDLVPIATAEDADASSASFLTMLGDQLRRGGKASLISRSDRYETITNLPPELGLPFEKLTSRTGDNVAEVVLTGDLASIDIKGQDVAYDIEGATTGSVTNDTFGFNAAFPVKQQDGPQDGRLAFTMEGVTISDSLWDLFDPNKALTREIKTIALEGRAGVSVQQDILSFAPGETMEPPFGFESIAIDRATLDLLGFTGDASGEVALAPAPNGVVTVTLTRWREMIEGLSQTSVAQNPQVGMSMLIASTWLDSYGAPGENEHQTVLKIEIDPATGLQINGKPLQ